jgi:hypothetical protein
MAKEFLLTVLQDGAERDQPHCMQLFKASG